MASSPRIFTETFNSRRQTPELRRNALSLFIVPPRAQASRRCETQATLSGKAAKLRQRFGPLTPSARSGNLIAGDGMKNGLSRSEQRTVSKTQKQPLDRKSPIQVSLSAASLNHEDIGMMQRVDILPAKGQSSGCVPESD